MKFKELREYQQEIISNGCGGKGGKIKPPNAGLFKDVCDQHDLEYYLGFTEKHRKLADKRLKKGIVQKINLMPVDIVRKHMLILTKWFIPDFLVKPIFRQYANMYYIGVRMFGWQFFYYSDKRQELP